MRRRSKLDDGGSSDKKYPYQPRRRSPVAVVICAILAAVASVIGIAIWRWTVGPGGIPVPTYLGRHPSAAATAQALGLLRTASLHGNCVTVRHDQLLRLRTALAGSRLPRSMDRQFSRYLGRICWLHLQSRSRPAGCTGQLRSPCGRFVVGEYERSHPRTAVRVVVHLRSGSLMSTRCQRPKGPHRYVNPQTAVGDPRRQPVDVSPLC